MMYIMQKPLGLMSLLDEESNFPKATDLTFASKLEQHLSSNSSFKGGRDGAFSIHHYAGQVRFVFGSLIFYVNLLHLKWLCCGL